MSIKNFSDDSSNVCPIAKTAKLVGDEWVLLIIRDLMDNSKRFNQLQHSVKGISPRTLTSKLKMLEKMKILKREVFLEVPSRVEYSLTEKGKPLSKIIQAMYEYGQSELKDE